MSVWSFSVGENGGKTLKTAGKYCDRDIAVNLDGAIPAAVDEQAGLLDQALAALEGKAAGGGGGGSLGPLSKYAKVIVMSTSSLSLTIDNPLGGLAKKVTVKRTSETATSSRKVQKYIADANLRLGVIELLDTSGAVRYPVRQVDSGVNNGLFMITDGKITLYRYNSANDWDVSDEYEVEIWQ